MYTENMTHAWSGVCTVIDCLPTAGPSLCGSIARGNHHQSIEVARHPGKARATQKAASQRPSAGERLRQRAGVRSPAGSVVRQCFASTATRAWVLHMWWVRELCQRPTISEEAQNLFQSGGHLEQDAPGSDSQGQNWQACGADRVSVGAREGAEAVTPGGTGRRRETFDLQKGPIDSSG